MRRVTTNSYRNLTILTAWRTTNNQRCGLNDLLLGKRCSRPSDLALTPVYLQQGHLCFLHFRVNAWRCCMRFAVRSSNDLKWVSLRKNAGSHKHVVCRGIKNWTRTCKNQNLKTIYLAENTKCNFISSGIKGGRCVFRLFSNTFWRKLRRGNNPVTEAFQLTLIRDHRII